MITLLLGGARSGKSAVAERLAAGLPGPVTYIATAHVATDDPDHVARVAAHRDRRDPSWTTIEAGPDLVTVLAATPGTVLVDSLGTWVTATCLLGPEPFAVAPDIEGLRRALLGRGGDAVVVSEEVGLGVHPSSELGRQFRDLLGSVNLAVAEIADVAHLVVAGRLLPLERADPNGGRS